MQDGALRSFIKTFNIKGDSFPFYFFEKNDMIIEPNRVHDTLYRRKGVKNLKDPDFNKIFEEFGQPIYRLALARTGDSELSHDIVQQVFLLLYKKKPSFADKTALRVWLIRVALKYISNERKRAENIMTAPLESASNSAVTDKAEFEFFDLLSTLPETLRDVTVLYYVEDMPINDIARALNIGRGAVKSRLLRAREQLSKIYKEELL